MQDVVATTEKASERKAQELLPAGEYRVKLVEVGEVRESDFKNKDGSPAEDYAFLTFEIVQGKRRGKQFDSSFNWTLAVAVNDFGERQWISPLREMIEAFIGRPMKDGERGPKLLERIMGEEREANAVVLVKATKKDKTKQYNKIETMSAIEDEDDEDDAPPPVKKRTPREILDGVGETELDEAPF